MTLSRTFLVLFVLALSLSSSHDAAAALSRAARMEVCRANMANDQSALRSYEDLVREHREDIRLGRKPAPKEIILHFEGGPADRDLYNSPGEIVTTYKGEKKTFFIGREESANSETNMTVAFYAKTKPNTYVYQNGEPGIPELSLQDPFSTEIYTESGRELILGGVKVWHVMEGGQEKLLYGTVFYRDHGKGIEGLNQFLAGPDRMKDIRLSQSEDKKTIAVLTRPQHSDDAFGGRGKVGLFVVSNLEEITPEKIANAPIFRFQFADGEWGGANAAFYLDKDHIGVIGHYARFNTAGDRDYLAASWIINTKTGVMTKPKVLLERSDLNGGMNRVNKVENSKRSDLKNVLFPGGAKRNLDGTYTIWGGEGDKMTFAAIVANPF